MIAAIGLGFDKKGSVKVLVPNRIYTLVHSIIRPEDGSFRLRPDVKKVPNWKYIKAHYLGCKPYHMNQGVAASNYKHWMRRTVSEYAYLVRSLQTLQIFKLECHMKNMLN